MSWYTNMAAVSLFWNTNMAAVTLYRGLRHIKVNYYYYYSIAFFTVIKKSILLQAVHSDLCIS